MVGNKGSAPDCYLWNYSDSCFWKARRLAGVDKGVDPLTSHINCGLKVKRQGPYKGTKQDLEAVKVKGIFKHLPNHTVRSDKGECHKHRNLHNN